MEKLEAERNIEVESLIKKLKAEKNLRISSSKTINDLNNQVEQLDSQFVKELTYYKEYSKLLNNQINELKSKNEYNTDLFNKNRIESLRLITEFEKNCMLIRTQFPELTKAVDEKSNHKNSIKNQAQLAFQEIEKKIPILLKINEEAY